jgi:hypothetical protein
MKTQEIENLRDSVGELAESYRDLFDSLKATTAEVHTARKLWRAENQSRLIKLGVALIVFPEPTPISETVGACFVAAGIIQKGVKNRSIYMEDIYKTLRNVMNEISSSKRNL